MNQAERKELWKHEESCALSGRDFSHLQGRYLKGKAPWDYRLKVLDFLRPGIKILDMGTGSGEFLLSLSHPRQLLTATEGDPANYRLCLRRLTSLGVTVVDCTCGEGKEMPFPDNSFDLVLNRHEGYDVGEVRRVLRDGGFFLTEQAGGQNSRLLAQRLLPERERPGLAFNLENEAPKFRKAGFRLVCQNQAYPMAKIMDVGALCFYAKLREREFPGFSVDNCLYRLLLLQREVEERGCLLNQEHRFLLIAKNRKGAAGLPSGRRND